MTMRDSLDLGAVKVAYHLIDIREFQAEELLASGAAGDLPLAMLAGGGAERLVEIAQRISNLGEVERRRAVLQIVLLAGLRRVSGQLKMELRRTGVMIDIRDNEILQDLFNEGVIEGLARGEVKLLHELLRAGSANCRVG
jgi:hypothetical protein